MGLEDYKELVANVASVCTMGHMLSGTLVCKDIYKKGSSEGFDAKPFVGGIGIGMLMFQYAFILNDPAMIKVNMFGLTTSILYVTVFYLYSPNKTAMMKLIAKTLGLASIFLAYAKFENPEYIEFRYGLLTTVLLLMLIGTPLMNLGQVIKTKSTEILPFPLIAMGTVVSFLWLLYGIIIDNGFIVFQNVVGLFLYIVQLSLFAIYPSKPKEVTSSHSKKE
ncbi:sugar transporter SWEET1 [Microplitis demolitor]|uniref:sugar transporter SWEET1 n=1 Tax=Microplitis demolitor TaxID=69319 RepID=UPI0004CDA3CB|nr:sugar transporter SWEET1 [Microplitis demolitor]